MMILTSAKGIGYGIFWALLMNFTSVINDVLAKLLGEDLHFIEIAFFRFLFSALTALIVIGIQHFKGLKSGYTSNHQFRLISSFQTKYHGYHILRSILGAVAIGLCCCSVNKLPLAENTIILFSDTLFMLPLASIFLKEKIGIKCWSATILGMIGIIIMYRPITEHLNILALIPTTAAILFATMNIMVKKMVEKNENNLVMLFYFGLYTTLLTAIFVPSYWTCPSIRDISLLLALGIGSNLIQLFLFLAYRATKASVISPIRYAELPISIAFGYLFFAQIPDLNSIIGAIIIIGTTYIMSRES
ncbi:MAG: DMT family transporter [Holosporales bacterium]|jgi:S-adenosylmethionine uptake transporter|nr:DMT family transporter [Holosporales bacterium]